MCWIGFGLLLNLIGFSIVAIGITALVAAFMRQNVSADSRRKPDWKNGLWQSGYVWIASAALIALALTLSEPLFFAFLAGALAMRVLGSYATLDRRWRTSIPRTR